VHIYRQAKILHRETHLSHITYIATLIALLLIAALPSSAKANETAFNFADNARCAIDASSRYTDTRKPNDANESWAQHVIGFDFYTKVIRDGQDIATIVFQPYWIELNNRASAPSFFSDGNDGALNWRIANINYTGLSRGGFNIRVGHLEVPFGLEQNIDSNGTLRQFSVSDRNIKADWGGSINGVMPAFEYEIAYTRGTGNNLSNDATNNTDPGIIAGRIGTLSTRHSIWGISFLDGDIVTGNTTSERHRIGIDWSYYHNNWEFLSEVSTGDNGTTDTENFFAEIAWNNLSDTIKIYQQWQYRTRELNNNINTRFFTLGAQWFINSKIDVSSAWSKTFADQSANDISTVNIQLRIRL
jgi:hypothetical protein